MSELTEGALLCYGVAKFRPFSHSNVDSGLLNAKIGICLLTSAVHYYSKKTKQVYSVPNSIYQPLCNYLKSENVKEEELIYLAELFFGMNKRYR